MRLVYFSDSHLRASRPRCRVDKAFYENQLAKLREVFQIATDEQDDAIYSGGDFYHSPDSPLSLIHDVQKVIFAKRQVPLKINPGNHDVFGANSDETLYRSGLGSLKSVDPGFIFERGEHEHEGIIVRSAPYTVSYPESFYTLENKPEGCVFAVIAHDMLTPRTGLPFEHKPIQTLKTNADLILCSHFHSQFLAQIGDSLFVNSGPIDPQTVTERHIKPAVVLIDIEKGKVKAKLKFLGTTGYEEIEMRDEDHKELGLADEFVAAIKQSDLAEGGDITEMVHKLGKDAGYSDSLIDRVLKRLQEAQRCVEAS